VTPFLKVKKHQKFMGPQDRLAVVSAGKALESAGMLGDPLGERTGLYLAVGYIPFEREDIDRLIESSVECGRFSMARFSSEGPYSVHPHLTFRCLSSMPAFHVSVNFGIQGPYFVTYPGIGQWYLALEEACNALAAGEIDIAVVGAVAYQRNFLVAHHLGRIPSPVPYERLIDAGSCLILARGDHARARSLEPRGRLLEYSLSYDPYDPLEGAAAFSERFDGCDGVDGEAGPASLGIALSRSGKCTVRHSVEGRDGICGRSRWEIA
jgi:3-oxoacyl-(acyl-carrier-protein) synthase